MKRQLYLFLDESNIIMGRISNSNDINNGIYKKGRVSFQLHCDLCNLSYMNDPWYYYTFKHVKPYIGGMNEHDLMNC